MKILILDTYYPETILRFAADHPEWFSLDEQAHTQAALGELFGTADFYSRHLRDLGWEVEDCIANLRNYDPVTTARARIHAFQPDVVFLQDFSLLPLPVLEALKAKGIFLAGQLSCPLPPTDRLPLVEVVFTSFPHYVPKLSSLGVRRVVYSPLACEPSAIERILAGRPLPARDIDVLFVGGVGRKVHWDAGTLALEELAADLGPRLHWYGYGLDYLEPQSPLRACYRGEAWGRQMYELLLRALVVVNRHGEVAAGYANNMRMFEATAAGALLVTEAAPNLADLFKPGEEVLAYGPGLLSRAVRWALEEAPVEAAMIAAAGQRRALSQHTYRRKMEQVDAVLLEELGQ